MKIAKPVGSSDKLIGKLKNTMNLSMNSLDILCKYVLANPAFVSLSHISNLNSMIRDIDSSVYKNDVEKMKRIKFIKRGIDARVSYKLTDKSMIISHILSGLDFNPDFIDFNSDMTYDEAMWTHKFIEQAIKYSYLYRYTDTIIELCTSIKSTDFEHRTNVVPEFQQIINMLGTEFRNAEIDDNLTDMTFSLTDGEFDNAITKVYETVTNPNRRLICGMQGLNRMTAGGFEEERVYVFLGVTGVGKSVTLLNLANQIRKYNPNYKPKDPTKTPCIVYLTMENTVVETVTRLFDLVTDSKYSMGSYSLSEVIGKLKQEGQLVINNNSPIDFVIKYKANKSVDTSYLYKLYDDLLSQGKEMICLLQDHLMRIRSIFGGSDVRLELGDIVNEFKTFAAQKQIPVITNFHLNREAMKIIEQYSNNKSSQIDTTKRIGQSNVSESVLILNNTDVAIVINKDHERGDDSKEYMVFSLIKMRDKTDTQYFAQPFAYGNHIRLIEDVNGPAMYKTALNTNENITSTQGNIRTSSMNSMGPIAMIAKDNKSMDTSFIDNDRYNNISYDEEDKDLNQIEDVQIKHPKVISPFVEPPRITYEQWYEQHKAAQSLMNDIKEFKSVI